MGNEDGSLAVSMVKMRQDAKEAGTELNYAGLEVLKDIDGLYIKQEWEILEQISSWYEQSNEYTIFDDSGKVQLFRAKEKTCCCFRLCCGENRPFRIKVYDSTADKEKAALVFKRKYRCCGWAVIPCCAHRVDVHYMVDPNGNTIGRESDRTLISQVQVPMCHGGCCFPTWRLKDNQGKTHASISGGSCCICDICGSDFAVNDAEGRKIGQIAKLRPKGLKGLALEAVSEADNFKLSFEKTLDPTIKMALMAATLQIDFTFFEDDRGPCQCRCCDIWCCGFACPCLPACFAALCFCCKGDKDKKKNASEHRNGAPATEEMIR